MAATAATPSAPPTTNRSSLVQACGARRRRVRSSCAQGYAENVGRQTASRVAPLGSALHFTASAAPGAPARAPFTCRTLVSYAGQRPLLPLTLGALGIVYGDIGTSPLYAMRECFYGSHSVAPTQENVLGVLSLIIWSLMLVVSVKYLVFVMRADNHGEGGILALIALLPPPASAAAGRRCWCCSASSARPCSTATA